MMSDESQVWCYIARLLKEHNGHSAGTVIAVTVDEPQYAKSTAETIAEWIVRGDAVERVPLEWARQYLMSTQVYQP
jgi:hypothetical protein